MTGKGSGRAGAKLRGKSGRVMGSAFTSFAFAASLVGLPSMVEAAFVLMGVVVFVSIMRRG